MCEVWAGLVFLSSGADFPIRNYTPFLSVPVSRVNLPTDWGAWGMISTGSTVPRTETKRILITCDQ